MDEAGILAMIAIPFAGFWAMLNLEGTPEKNVTGQARKIVQWLSDFCTHAGSSLALCLAMTSTLCSVYALFDYAALQARGWVPWYFGLCVVLIVLECAVIAGAKLFYVWGRKDGLLE